MGDAGRTFDVTCPCCHTRLTLDADSAEVLIQERPKRSGMAWDEALHASNQRTAEAETMFRKGIERERNADDLLEKKFREALKKADKSDDPPPRIYDLD